jgi:hypothetical protein
MVEYIVIIRKIISGGQTGADRAALDAARELGVTTGGWVPKGRRAEDGSIPDRYLGLRETPGDDYETRTRWNVHEADATLILSHGPLTGGSKLTELIARELRKAVLHVDLSTMSADGAVDAIRAWLAGVAGETLNVAGPRASGDAAIYDDTKAIIAMLMAPR